jgi:hypothetical protein
MTVSTKTLRELLIFRFAAISIRLKTHSSLKKIRMLEHLGVLPDRAWISGRKYRRLPRIPRDLSSWKHLSRLRWMINKTFLQLG